jgi:putative transposase
MNMEDAGKISWPYRKIPAHPPPRFLINKSILIFLTVCTEKRKTILCREQAHQVLLDSWIHSDAWLVGRYVVMPDHIHLFCSPSSWDYSSLGKWVQYWKALTAKHWPWKNEKPIWQKSFWDRQLRKAEQYSAKWEYVRDNPVRKRLVVNADEWLYQGELTEFIWEEL